MTENIGKLINNSKTFRKAEKIIFGILQQYDSEENQSSSNDQSDS